MAAQVLANPQSQLSLQFNTEAISMKDPRPSLTVNMLGPFRASDADGNDRLPRVRKTRAVLAILTLAAPQPVARSQLIALLWSRRAPQQARGSLRQATHELRVALGPSGCLLRAETAHLALSDDGLRVDVGQILRATPAQPGSLALWQGGMLTDLIGLDPAFDQWLGEQQRCLWSRVRAVGELILAEAEGTAAIVVAAERLLVIDSAHEDAWRFLIRCHIECGDRVAAIGTYERCCAALSAQCQIGPSAETTALVAGLRVRPTTLASVSRIRDVAVEAPRRRVADSRIRLGVAPLRSTVAGGTAELAAGLAEELIIALSRFRWLACIPCAAEQSEQGMDYLLDGSVQRSDDRLRVLLRVMDLNSCGEVVWAERFDHRITDIFTLQDRLASTMAAQLEPQLWLWEGERVGAGGSEPRTAQDLLRLAVPALHRLDRRGFVVAGHWLDQSIQLDADNAAAHAWAAQWHIFAVGQGWAANPAAIIARAHDLVDRAIRLDPEDARGLTLAGHVRGFIDHRPQEALRLHERAIAANPNLPLSWCLSGLAHTYAGDCEAAIDHVRHAQILSPRDPLGYFFEMALAQAYLYRGDPAAAAQAGLRAIALNSRFSSTFKPHLAALGHLGRAEAATETRAALLALEPGFTIEEALRRSPITDPTARVLYADGLRLGGLAAA